MICHALNTIITKNYNKNNINDNNFNNSVVTNVYDYYGDIEDSDSVS